MVENSGKTNHAEKKRSNCGIFGKTGWGKSWIVREHLNRGVKREVIIDTMGEHDEAILFTKPGKLVDYCCSHKVFCVRVVDPAHFDLIAKMLMLPEFGKTTITIEEAYLYYPSETGMTPEAQTLLYQGRHNAVSMNLLFQRPTQCNINLRSQLDNLITFRQSEPRDADYFRRMAGYDLDKLEVLEPGHCYVIDSSSCREYFFPDLKKFVDSGLESSRLDLRGQTVD